MSDVVVCVNEIRFILFSLKLMLNKISSLAEKKFEFFFKLLEKKAVFFIILASCLVFINSLFNGFVWDDGFQIVNNEIVHNGNIFYYFSHTNGPHYRPLMFFLYSFIYQLFNLHSFIYHFLQLALYTTNAILVFYLFKDLSKKSVLSLIIAILFLIHPINAEAAIYIADLQEVLFMFFGLSALLIFIKKNQLNQKNSNILTMSLLLLSQLSKETGILFVIVYIAYAFFFTKRERLKACFYAALSTIIYLSIRLPLVGFHPTSFNAIPPGTITAASFAERLLSIPKIIFFYLKTFIYPIDLNSQYWYVATINLKNFIVPLLLDVFILIFFIILGSQIMKKNKERAKGYWFFLFWLCLGLAFHLPFFPPDATVAIRWFYFPIIGLLGMLLYIFKTFEFNTLKEKHIWTICILVIFSAFSLKTIIRNTDWYDTEVYFTRNMYAFENNANAQYNLGTSLSEKGQYKNATIHLQKATGLSPDSYQIWHNLGIAYLHLNKLDEAKNCFIKEISLKKDFSFPYRSLIYILILQKDFESAKETAESALKTWPSDHYLWRMLGLSEYELNNKESAKNYFQKSQSISQDPITSYYLNQLKNNLPIEIREL